MKKTVVRIMAVLLALLSLNLAPVTRAEETEKEYGTITAEGVKLRMMADKESPALAELSLGTAVEIIAEEGAWFRILYNDTVGYVRSEYLFTDSEGGRGAYVLDDNAELRGGPDDTAYVITGLSAGQGVKIKAVMGEWYFVSVNDQSGYVYRTKLTMTQGSTASGSMLKVGMEGGEVTKLQNALYDRGFLTKANITGTYDSNTRAAVLEYQKAAGLSSADGVAGTETQQSVYDSSNDLKKSNATFMQLKGTVVMLNWFEGGSEWLAKGSRFTVTDVKTGLSFRVRRFGGWYHADCEPITAYDTSVMKRIAGGKWSWDRRAIWVTYNGKTVAASMHCMPHMVNPTKSNNFDGHFCIHLKGSLVHENSKECPRHQACVYAAYKAGRAN